MFQAYFGPPAPIPGRLAARCHPICLDLREVRRRMGERENGRREILMRDPDGYLVALAEEIGERFLGAG
jgi:hypothetical protein